MQRVVIDLQPSGQIAIYSDQDVEVIRRCAHLPEDKLI
jgi:hypothetical protein